MERLLDAVDAAFTDAAVGTPPWPDPHPDRTPSDDEYSRVSDPQKWRIVGARAQAWLAALEDLGLATRETDVDVRWREQEPPTSHLDRAVPAVPHALPLVVAASPLAGVDDAGVVLGVGDPAFLLARIPDCGCDACDSGSQDALDEVDSYVAAVVSGVYRRLWKGDRVITELGDRNWQGSNIRLRDVRAGRVQTDDWLQLSGASWLTDS